MKYIKYKHHGKEVSVREDLKGKHREYCLCWKCAKFFPDDKKKSCPIANRLFELDIDNIVTTPVWECADFKEKQKGENDE